jgi:hypothetical protein
MAGQTKAEIEAELTALKLEYAEFREKVRDKAYAVAEQQSWCGEGVRGTLLDLGLEPYPVDFTVTLSLRIQFIQQATSEDKIWDDYNITTTQRGARLARLLDVLTSGDFRVLDVDIDEVDES